MEPILYNGLPLEEGSGGKVTFLLGENGSGKSRELQRLARSFASRGVATIAISNTVFDRFPVKKASNYVRLSPASGKRYAQRALKNALFASDDEGRDARLVARTLDYAGFDHAVGVLPILGPPERAEDIYEKLRGEGLSKEKSSVIAQIIDNAYIIGHRDALNWYHLYDVNLSYKLNIIRTLISNEAALRRLKIIRGIEFFLRKGGDVIPLAQASSGEITLIATYAFLATHITDRAAILIDEPENSLHPRWQSEYCDRLFDLFHLYEPSIFIASHSPIIVSGAESNNVDNRIVSLTPNLSHHARDDVRSIDGILLEAFGVLAPESHYLSELVSILLSDLSAGRQGLPAVVAKLKRLKERSYDHTQQTFLNGAIDLATSVDHEAKGAQD